jgi:hypothetical protein
MAKINIQFHGLPQEIVDFIKASISKFQIYAVTMCFKPEFKVALIDMETNIDYDFLKKNNIDCVSFLLKKPSLCIENERNFISEYPDSLFIDIGIQTKKGLNESCLSAISNDHASLKCWKKIVKEFNKITFTGAWSINPHTSAKAFFKNHRYTSGAKELDLNGVSILPAAGWNIYKFTEPV